MRIIEDANGRKYVIRDDGLMKPLSEADPIWVELGERYDTKPSPAPCSNE